MYTFDEYVFAYILFNQWSNKLKFTKIIKKKKIANESEMLTIYS